MSGLVFYGFFITVFSPSLANVRLVDENGTRITIESETLCYGDNYNLWCNGGVFAPIENTFGLKIPNFSLHRNCSHWHFPYPRDCCVKDSTDCTFPSIKGFSQLRDACSGRNVCNGTNATYHPVFKNYPKMNEDSCPEQSNITGTGLLETQYVTTKYACIPLITMSTICNASVHTGKGLFVVSPDYPASPRYKFGVSGYTCTCHVNVSSDVTLTVAAVDLRLCKDEKKECGKSLTLGEKVVNYTHTQEVQRGMYGFSGLKKLYSEVPENSTMDITLKTMDYKDEVHVWIYLYANGSDIRLECDKLSLFASPEIQTTTPTTASTIAATTSHLTTAKINLTVNRTYAISNPETTRLSVTTVPQPNTTIPILSTTSNPTSTFPNTKISTFTTNNVPNRVSAVLNTKVKTITTTVIPSSSSFDLNTTPSITTTTVPDRSSSVPVKTKISSATAAVKNWTSSVPNKTITSITTSAVQNPTSSVPDMKIKSSRTPAVQTRTSTVMNPTIIKHSTTIQNLALTSNAATLILSARNPTKITPNLITTVQNPTAKKTLTTNHASTAQKYVATGSVIATIKPPTFSSTSKLSIGKQNTLSPTMGSPSTFLPISSTSSESATVSQRPTEDDTTNIGLMVGASVGGGIVFIIVIIIIVCVVRKRRRHSDPPSPIANLNADSDHIPVGNLAETSMGDQDENSWDRNNPQKQIVSELRNSSCASSDSSFGIQSHDNVICNIPEA